MNRSPISTAANTPLIAAMAMLAAAVVALLGISTGVGADKVASTGSVAVPTAVTINANADAYVDSGKPDINYGSAANLYVSLYGSPANIQQTLAKFSLAAIPAGATIDDARFELYLNSASGLATVNLSLGRNVTDWKESDVAFSNRPGCSPMGATATVGSTAGWYGWYATALVGDWLRGAFNYGVCATGPGSGSLYTRRFTSREGSAAPRLVVKYYIPTVTPTPTRTWTSVPPSPTPTRTWTSVPPSPTPTRTYTSVPPTPTPTRTWTSAPLSPTPTNTQYPIPNSPTPTATFIAATSLLSLLPAQGGPGIAVQVAGLRFPTGQAIVLYWDQVAPDNRLAQTVADAAGAFSANITVSAAASPGGHSIIAHYAGALLAQRAAAFRVLASPAISLAPDRGPRGAQVTITLAGLNGNGAITLYWDAGRLLGPIPLAGATSWQGVFTAPLAASTGAHMVYADNTILGRPITRAGGAFEVLPGPAPSPTPSPTPWPLRIQAPAHDVLGQPVAVAGQAAPGERVGIGIFGRWLAEDSGQSYAGMPILTTVIADANGNYSAELDTASITTAGAGQTDAAVGVASLRGPSFGGTTELDVPTADVTGYVTYGRDRVPASWADVRANTEQLFIYEDQANRDGYYQLFLWDEVVAGQATTADLPFPPLPTRPGGDLQPGLPLFPAGIYATHRETDDQGNLVAYRWSDTLPFDVRSGEQRRIDIHLNHEVLSGPAITSVTASLDARRDDHTFGTFLSLLSLPEDQRVPVWNTFTAQVEPIAPSTEVRRVEFTLGNLTITDRTPGNGWSARFDMAGSRPDHEQGARRVGA